MQKTILKDRIELLCREVLREATELVGKPTNPVVDDFTEIVDPAANLTNYQESNITYQESLVAGQTLKKILSYMSQRGENLNIDEVKQTILELIVEASKIYAHVLINQPKKEVK